MNPTATSGTRHPRESEDLATLHDAGRAPASLGQVIAAVRFTARLAGTPNPAGPATTRVLAYACREGRTRDRGQAAGVQWAQADDAAAQAAHGDSSLAVMSDAMLRRSECASLDVDDIQTDPWSDTDPPF